MLESGTKTEPYLKKIEYAGEIIVEYEDFIRLIIRTQNITNMSEDDLFQDFYLSLIAKPAPENVRNMKSFLYKAIINHLSSSCQRIRAYEKKIAKYQKNYNFKVNKIESASALLIREETNNNIFELIKKNTPNKKYMAIVLRYRDGYSIKEVADKMGIKYTSVTRYLSTGLRKVRHCIGNV
ncbi:MAG: sigma-70 family RNA polymerase sigma factor [Sedimentisphaerales bacterium]|nr:sigma-70 family RNA polymerase sigma factor [Sedimentisphaerales bacterium]